MERCILAIKYLEVIQGSQNLGLESLKLTDFTADEFELVSYLQSQIKKMQIGPTKGRPRG